MADEKENASVTEMIQDTIDWISSLTPYDDIDQKDKRQVLPTNITPKHYFISYTNIDLTSKFKFNGRVEIDLQINKQSNEITINSCDIEYKSISVRQGDNNHQNIDIKNINYDEKTEQAIIPLNSTLEIGVGKLIIEFIGNLNDKMKGFYRSKYKLCDGSDGYCGITQFEATDARRAFPCWDEPGIKSTFSLEITCNKSLTILSNMPIISSSQIDGDGGDGGGGGDEMDNPLMDIIIKSHQKTKKDKKKDENKRESTENKSILSGLPMVPYGNDVYSGNTKIGGLFGRYKFKKQCRNKQYGKNQTFSLKIGLSKYNPLLEIWGINYLKQIPKDPRRAKQIYKEMPINTIRWLDSKEMNSINKQTTNKLQYMKQEKNNGNNKVSSDVKLKNYLKNQLNVILKNENNINLFNDEQRHKILESSHKKVLKAWKQINDKQVNPSDKQTLSQFIDNMQSKINDLVGKYVVQYKKRTLNAKK
eukprot:439059_1